MIKKSMFDNRINSFSEQCRRGEEISTLKDRSEMRDVVRRRRERERRRRISQGRRR